MKRTILLLSIVLTIFSCQKEKVIEKNPAVQFYIQDITSSIYDDHIGFTVIGQIETDKSIEMSTKNLEHLQLYYSGEQNVHFAKIMQINDHQLREDEVYTILDNSSNLIKLDVVVYNYKDIKSFFWIGLSTITYSYKGKVYDIIFPEEFSTQIPE